MARGPTVKNICEVGSDLGRFLLVTPMTCFVIFVWFECIVERAMRGFNAGHSTAIYLNANPEARRQEMLHSLRVRGESLLFRHWAIRIYQRECKADEVALSGAL